MSDSKKPDAEAIGAEANGAAANGEAEAAPNTERPPPPDPSDTAEYGALMDDDLRDTTLRGMRVADILSQDPEMTVSIPGDPEATVNLTGDPREIPPRDDTAVEIPGEGEGGETQGAESDGERHDEAADFAPTPMDASDVTRTHLKGLLEALIFVSDAPIRAPELAKSASAPLKDVKALLAELRAEYTTRGVQLDEVAGGWIFRTSAAYAPFVRDLTKQKAVKLTRAQIETLAILAYRQPITRPEIDEIRGVDSGPVLKMLLERDLVKILGKKDEPGRPLLYGTTGNFLEFFGLKSLKDLPTLREFTELNEDSRRVVERELGESLETAQTVSESGEPAGEEMRVSLPDDLRDQVQDTLRPAKLEDDETYVDTGSSDVVPDGKTTEIESQPPPQDDADADADADEEADADGEADADDEADEDADEDDDKPDGS